MWYKIYVCIYRWMLRFVAIAEVKLWIRFQNYMGCPNVILLLLTGRLLILSFSLRDNCSIFHLQLPNLFKRLGISDVLCFNIQSFDLIISNYHISCTRAKVRQTLFLLEEQLLLHLWACIADSWIWRTPLSHQFTIYPMWVPLIYMGLVLYMIFCILIRLKEQAVGIF